MSFARAVQEKAAFHLLGWQISIQVVRQLRGLLRGCCSETVRGMLDCCVYAELMLGCERDAEGMLRRCWSETVRDRLWETSFTRRASAEGMLERDSFLSR